MFLRLLGASAAIYLFVALGIDTIDRLGRGWSLAAALDFAWQSWRRGIAGREAAVHIGLVTILVLFSLLGAWVARRSRPLWGWITLLAPVLLLAGFVSLAFWMRTPPPQPPACCAPQPEPYRAAPVAPNPPR